MKAVIGLAVGRGTGPELAAVFERTATHLGRLHGVDMEFARSPRLYHSYYSLRVEGGLDLVRSITEEDAEHYEGFCRAQAARGTSAVFRTAINPRSLHLVRRRFPAVEVEVLASSLLIRDETARTAADTDKVIAYALRRAARKWEGGADHVVVTGSRHPRHGVDVRLSHPPHGGPREGWFTESVHLHPEVDGLVEYQAAHGSADDLEGRDAVNPVATIRAAAAIAERHAGCAGVIADVERALLTIAARGIGTADVGGAHSTTEVVDALLDALQPDLVARS